MLAKRLDLWRLANFRLERLASAEDVYLFHGVAHDNPKDHRLFALAEVRDLTPVADAHGRRVVPLARSDGAAGAGRDARGTRHLPARGSARPANRIVLYVRPRVGRAARVLADLARSFAPLAEGADLEKVLLRVRIAEPNGSLRDAVLDVQGVGGQGVTVLERPPRNEPVRPLTPYRQKVLMAQRFGVPYPYEILRMLTGRPGASARLPTWHVRRARPRRRRPPRTGRPGAGAQHRERRRRCPHQPHGEGPRGHEPGRAARATRPGGWATSPSRSAAGSWPRSTSPSGCRCRSSGSRCPRAP